jgi:hypothetical protein
VPDPWIEPTLNGIYFHDAYDVEWLVTDMGKRDGRWTSSTVDRWNTHRIFQRMKFRGPFSPIPLETRAYRFRPDDVRHSYGVGAGQRWQAQLDASELRAIRIPGVPRITEGWLLASR